MQVTRLDLDGTGSPLGLVQKILAAEPNLRIPVPIEELAEALDIAEIAELTTEGFEGGLLTNVTRSFGGILVRKGMDRRRRRFTIGDELGHFLIPTHQPAKPGEFLCSRQDMLQWNTNEQNRAARMEVEANRFSAGILIPAPHLRKFLARPGDPKLAGVLSVHEHFDVSKEAAARAYTSFHGAKIAIVVARNGKVMRSYRATSFPRMTIQSGSALPRLNSNFEGQAVGTITTLSPARAENWLEGSWGVALPTMYEQVLVQSEGFLLVLLWCDEMDETEDYDPDEGKTAKERFRDRAASQDPFDRR